MLDGSHSCKFLNNHIHCKYDYMKIFIMPRALVVHAYLADT